MWQNVRTRSYRTGHRTHWKRISINESTFLTLKYTHRHEKRTLIKMVSLQRQKIHWARFVLFSVLNKQHTHYLLIFIKIANNKGIFLPKRCMRLLFSRADIFVGMVRWRQKIRIINIQMDTYMQNIKLNWEWIEDKVKCCAYDNYAIGWIIPQSSIKIYCNSLFSIFLHTTQYTQYTHYTQIWSATRHTHMTWSSISVVSKPNHFSIILNSDFQQQISIEF